MHKKYVCINQGVPFLHRAPPANILPRFRGVKQKENKWHRFHLRGHVNKRLTCRPGATRPRMCPTAANYTEYPTPSVTKRTDMKRGNYLSAFRPERCDVCGLRLENGEMTRAQIDTPLTWRWCWCRWCTRSRLNTGSGRWSCWFWWASILGSSSGSGTWPTGPVLSASPPKQNNSWRRR